MTKHLMIDIETLATTPDAAILTIGAVKFNPFGDDRDKASRKAETFYKRIDLDSNIELGRTINEDTLRWWCDQSEDISHEAFVEEDRLPITTVLKDLYKFGWGTSKVWGHGSAFDMVILEHACRQIQQAVPWDYYNVRDTRTLYDLTDAELPNFSGHHALYDAMKQAIGVQNCYRKLGYNG